MTTETRPNRSAPPTPRDVFGRRRLVDVDAESEVDLVAAVIDAGAPDLDAALERRDNLDRVVALIEAHIGAELVPWQRDIVARLVDAGEIRLEDSEPAGEIVISCPSCSASIGSPSPHAALEHHADGSHTFSIGFPHG
jgi:hypothetical protein